MIGCRIGTVVHKISSVWYKKEKIKEISEGAFTIDETVAAILDDNNHLISLTMMQVWPEKEKTLSTEKLRQKNQ